MHLPENLSLTSFDCRRRIREKFESLLREPAGPTLEFSAPAPLFYQALGYGEVAESDKDFSPEGILLLPNYNEVKQAFATLLHNLYVAASYVETKIKGKKQPRPPIHVRVQFIKPEPHKLDCWVFTLTPTKVELGELSYSADRAINQELVKTRSSKD